MIEGDGWKSIEAGPSGSRDVTTDRWDLDFISDRVATPDDMEELAREAEADALESNLDAPPPLYSLSSQANTTASIPFPVDSSPGNGAADRPGHASHLSEGKLVQPDTPLLHSSSSEIFDVTGNPQSLTRQTTYSSLPPSPRLANHSSEYPLTPHRGLGIKELQSAFKRLESNTEPRILFDVAHGETQDEEESRDEQFWPARSRRPTIDKTDSTQYVQLDTPTEKESLPKTPSKEKKSGLSIWDLLKDETGAEEWEGWVVDGKWERMTNFLAVPLAVERVTMFGALLCLDGFLYNFTVLPIRASFAASRIITRLVKRQAISPVPPSHIHSLLRMMLLFLPSLILLIGTDTSKMYHAVRGQDTIKLYVIFNALEIADRLCCAFGQDVLDTLFARDTLAPDATKRGRKRKREHARPFFFFALSLGYVLAHSLIFFYMLVSLNVAINSYDYTLLSLLISNQFVEIKGSVFKKFEKENLFQIMCADIVERFQLALMLVVIAFRNLIEMAGSDLAFLPKSYVKGKSLLETILSPVLFVLVSEMIVDWLKHAFITKFNHVRASVYDRFADVLAKDVLTAGTIGNGRGRFQNRKHPILLDQSPLVARRLGFASIPLACLVIRVCAQAVGMLATSNHSTDGPAGLNSGWFWITLKWTGGLGIAISAWGCLVILKVLLGLALLSYSAVRQTGMDTREAEDSVNDFGRAGVGESKEEMEYNKETKRYLSQTEDDLPDHSSRTSPTARRVPGTPRTASVSSRSKDIGQGEDGGRTEERSAPKEEKKKWKLEEVERWTMVKRIW